MRHPGDPAHEPSARVPADRTAEWFTACYGTPPAGVWFAPGRVNLIGEHTDYNDGLVLPFALERGVMVAGATRGDGVIEVLSRQAGTDPVRLPLGRTGPGMVHGWAAYPAGVAWALRAAGHSIGGATLVIDSDLPEGAGLSSSAALECAVGLALTGLHGLRLPRAELAAITRRAENEVVGVPSGIMDQSASLLCRADHALLLDCRTGEHDAVPLRLAGTGLEFLVIDTGARHALADGRYAQRRAQCRAAARLLGVRSLRDIADVSCLTRLPDQELASRARHVVTENERVRAAATMLWAEDVAGVGAVLTASHTSLAADFAVSWPQADVAVAAAAGAGALGARMMGGGFGGSVLALAPAADPAVRAAVVGAFAGRGWAPPAFLTARPSASARRLR